MTKGHMTIQLTHQQLRPQLVGVAMGIVFVGI